MAKAIYNPDGFTRVFLCYQSMVTALQLEERQYTMVTPLLLMLTVHFLYGSLV
jgi:hypothetical protein